MKYQNQYKMFCEDGWPLCPNCGKNELQGMPTVRSGSKLLMDECINNGLQCLYCSWQSIEIHRQIEDYQISQQRQQGLINQT